MAGEIGYGARIRISTEGVNDLGGAILEIEAGKSTDMVFHRNIRKIFYLLTGKLKATVISAGQVKSLEVLKGTSFSVDPGLVYQLSGTEKSVLIEFCNASPTEADKDTYIISRGSATVERVPDGSLAQMSKVDLERLKAEGEKLLAARNETTPTIEPEEKTKKSKRKAKEKN